MFKPGDLYVQKFGGSSVANPERIFKVAERIAAQAESGKKIAVVVSAMGETTDDLISIIRGFSTDPNPRELDQLMATGEMVSCSLLTVALQKLGIKAKSFNAFNLGIITDQEFGSAQVKRFANIIKLAEFLLPKHVAVIAGFQGITENGDLTTLGRGGSDITAVALANELGQKVCEKFTDEDGVYSADPRFIPNARKVWHLTFDEMENLARYGNGILNSRSVLCAKSNDVRIHVRSSFTHKEGSIIGPLGDESVPLKSITWDRNQAIVTIQGTRSVEEIIKDSLNVAPFSIMGKQWVFRNGYPWEFRVLFKTSDSFEALPFLWSLAEKVSATEVLFNAKISVLSIIGCGIGRDLTVLPSFLQMLQRKNVSPCFMEQAKIRFTVAVKDDQTELAMKTLHEAMVNGFS